MLKKRKPGDLSTANDCARSAGKNDRKFTIELPFPVSTNTYWRFVPGNARPLVSQPGREFCIEVRKRVMVHPERRALPLSGSLGIDMTLTVPDHRRRDLDNHLKPLIDALMHAGIFLDDCQIDEIHARKVVSPGGKGVVVSVWEL